MDIDDFYTLYYLDEEEASANTHRDPVNVEEELHLFRSQWKQEITSKKVPEREVEKSTVEEKQVPALRPSDEDEARYLFLQGTKAEQRGQFSDAVQYYRRAVQIVPDIEFKIEELKSLRKERPGVESEISLPESDNREDAWEDLCAHFHKIYLDDRTLCQPSLPQKAIHISDLPVEVVVYIFKWVVSSELDVQSLENLARVCRGFYLFAREEELWKMICQRVWGSQCGEATNYGSFRSMYIKRRHMFFNGCYISRCTYFRQGDMLMHNLYRPFQMVEYFRYIRFYPDGRMLMVTSPDQPRLVVGRLKSHNTGLQGILTGYYKVDHNQITAILKRRKMDYTSSAIYRHQRKNRNNNQNDDYFVQTFHVKLELTSSKSRRHSILTWVSYSCHSKHRTSEEKVAEFEITDETYPAMVFSRVKSYTALAAKPLSATNINRRM